MGFEQQIAEVEGPVRHKLTVEDFLILDSAGAFESVGRVELIDGDIFVMAPLHRPHARILLQLTLAVGLAMERFETDLEALTPVSSRLDDHSLPEPDIVIAVRADADFVTSATARLMIEVSDSSLSHDLGPKAALYARTGVPEYWVADVKGRRIIRMHDPVDGAYQARSEHPFGETIASVTIPGLVVDTARLSAV